MNFLIQRILSFKYAFRGIATVFRTQPNMWIHLLATTVVFTAAIYFKIKWFELAILTVTISTVWIAEFLNTAIEFVVDLASPEHHELAGKAKDVASGAVLVAAFFSVLIAFLIFAKYFFLR